LAGAPAATLVVLHGLEGSSSSHYVLGLLAQAQARGWSGLALNFRGCSGELNRLLRSYHSGETGDLRELVRRVRSESPGRPLLFVGWSLGGNVLVKWLGEEGKDLAPEVKGAAAISVPFDLAACADALDGPGAMARVYRTRFLRTLTRKSMQKAPLFPGAFDVARLRDARTLREFDEVLTSRIHGFAGAEDYYTQSSSGPYVALVRAPLLLLSAEDDPFIPASAIPREAARRNPHVTLEVHERGGHLGFVEGSPLRPSFYAERRALQFLEERLRR
jgi:predicted alpha/beta-fold hydrolase